MEYRHKIHYQNKDTAGNYDLRFHSLSSKWNHLLEASFLRKVIENNSKIKNALDVACGTGRLTRELINCGIEDITGTDISEEMMEVARQNCSGNKIKVDFQKGDANQLPFKDNKFDLVISFRFLDHLPVVEKIKAITEIIRVSNKYMVFTMANLNPWTKAARGIRKIFNKNYYEGYLIDEKDIIKLLSDNNVSILKRKIRVPLIGMGMMYFCENRSDKQGIAENE